MTENDTQAATGRKLERISVKNDLEWGRLVKAWVKGEETVPSSLSELSQQCQKRGFAIIFPPYLKSVVFIQPSMEVMFVRLPPKELVKDSEDFLNSPGGTYELPAFYEKRFGVEPNLPTVDDRKAFHDERIGDYTITLCV